MRHSADNSKQHRCGRLLSAIFLGHPQVLVTVPLSIGLLVHAIVRGLNREPTHGWTPRELVHCTGVVTAIAVFATISVWYMLMVILASLKRNGNGADSIMEKRHIGGHRLDCIVSQAHLLQRIADIAKSRRLVGPVAKPGMPGESPQHFYEEIDDVNDLALTFPYCVYSPKHVLLPARETLFQFDNANGNFEAVSQFDDRPTAIVGVHPCDLHAIAMLDAAFGDGLSDSHYMARRTNTFLVGIDCVQPCTTGVFCSDIGSNTATTGFDVMLYPMSDVLKCGSNRGSNGNGSEASEVCYGVMFGSDAGRAWLKGGPDDDYFLPEGSDREAFDVYLENKQQAFPRTLDPTWEDVPGILDRSYDSLLWKATGRRCYSCGSCNLVCPTCYCFDIQDETELRSAAGRRERTWDGCMLREFAAVAGGHNFRDAAANRLRHRIYRKGKWIKERTGHGGCVGCARCDRACTAQISIKQILNQLSEEAHHARN